MTCLMRAYVLMDVMLCWRKCLIGSNVLVECMSSGCHLTICCVLLEDMSYGGHFFLMVCIVGGHVLQFEMS